MGKLSREQLREIEKYLDRQGLNFKPLRDELTDHLIGDLEARLEQGDPFEDAWDRIKGGIPDHHFKTLQKEIMETIDKRFTLSRVFTYLSLVLLFAAVAFKLLHFPLSGPLLLAAFGAMIAALFTGSLLGVVHYKEKKGGLMVFGAIVGTTLFLVSFGFQILHLPGAAALRTISVVLLVLFFPGLTIYFGANGATEENILTYLHKKHSPGIEQYLLYLFTLAVALSIALIAFRSTPDIAHILLLLVIGGAGLQCFALNWHNQKGQSWWLTTGLVLAFLCFIIPVLPGMSYPVRVVLTTCFYMIMGLVVLNRSRQVVNEKILFFLIALVIAIFGVWGSIRLDMLDLAINAVVFNLPVLAVLLSGLVYFIKHSLIKVYLLMVIGHYLFEYPYELGLW